MSSVYLPFPRHARMILWLPHIAFMAIRNVNVRAILPSVTVIGLNRFQITPLLIGEIKGVLRNHFQKIFEKIFDLCGERARKACAQDELVS